MGCDAAVALVLKRLEDAVRDGDRLYAVIQGVGAATGPGFLSARSRGDVRGAAARKAQSEAGVASSSIGLLEIQGVEAALPSRWHDLWDSNHCAQASLEREIGEPGAAAGLASVVRASLCLHHQMRPVTWVSDRSFDETSARSIAAVPSGAPQFWLRNRAEGARRADVSALSHSASSFHVILEEPPCTEDLVPAQSPRRAQLMETRPLGIFALEASDNAGLSGRVRELVQMAREASAEPADVLARRWWMCHPNDSRLPRAVAVVAADSNALQSLLSLAEQRIGSAADDSTTYDGGSIYVRPEGLPPSPGRMAFIYPGLGNHFDGMGRELSTLWPEVLRAQDAEIRYLRDQLDPAIWWNGGIAQSANDPQALILGQISIGSLVSDVLRGLAVAPTAAIGYSMGESAALVALRAWTDRDELLLRLRGSPLFRVELAGPCNAARQVWRLPAGEPVDWIAGIVPRSAEDVTAAIAHASRVYVLIKNSRDETVVGGSRRAIEALVQSRRWPFIELPTVSTVHCEIGRVVERDYCALHDLATVPPDGITFYSGIWGRPVAVDRRSVALAIAAHATQPIDYHAVIEQAYEDGVRYFVEVGPGSSCTRLINRILKPRPHVAVSACRPDRGALAAILDVLGTCIAHRLPVDLGRLYGPAARLTHARELETPGADSSKPASVRIEIGSRAIRLPRPPSISREAVASGAAATNHKLARLAPVLAECDAPRSQPMSSQGRFEGRPASPRGWLLLEPFQDAQRAGLEAHRAYLRLAESMTDLLDRIATLPLRLIDDCAEDRGAAGPLDPQRPVTADGGPAPTPVSPEVVFDRSQCLEFAVGSIAAVLGPDFAEVDRFPARVRLPGEPLMLVDRILAIEGRPRSLAQGRVVTEHVIHPGAWYLENRRVASFVAMEAGQADLVLCGYLGVDFVTRGQAVYRLLDATVTFHRGLPGPGETIRYDIRITSFFRQGTTILFRFEFDGTVAGRPLVTMRDGCAGFFTALDLASGKGILPKSLECPSPRVNPATTDFELVTLSPVELDERKVDALRQGRLGDAFDAPFDLLALEDPIALPGGRMSLIRRVRILDPRGGAFGLGLIHTEADIEPGEWFMACHFVDDPVMPGTLMYECCLHSLRIFMLRLGWIGRQERVAFEPVPGIANRLRCRGQIVPSTRTAAYKLTIKERGFRPEPYAVADALILADGKPIVAVTDLALQLSGTSGPELERLWEGSRRAD
jgi:PfaB family protein